MSDSRTERRKPNGKRFGPVALAAQVASELPGMVLAQAFVVARSAGYKLHVHKHDGVPRDISQRPGEASIMVDVVSGIVKKSWASLADQAR